ncbi:M23 family metallopeptidase [Longispora albida]|uniref:M23 family metallopeptidase n=1 Tax=Longispora albida TaxID=203523 RepID=UPI00036924CF|nr:peptidoglycan DD-metalloendopeptidase family protein [Longispora albida]
MTIRSAVSWLGAALLMSGAAAVFLLSGLPAGAADQVPAAVHLVSSPIAASAGQAVTHRLVVRGAEAAGTAGVQVTFETTADVTGLAASGTDSACEPANTRSVRCRVVTARQPGEPAVIVVTGQISPEARPGDVVRNQAVVTAAQDPDQADNVSANAYVLTAVAGPAAQPSASPAPEPGSEAGDEQILDLMAPATISDVLPSSPGEAIAFAVLIGGLAIAGLTGHKLFVRGHRFPGLGSRLKPRLAYRGRHRRSVFRRRGLPAGAAGVLVLVLAAALSGPATSIEAAPSTPDALPHPEATKPPATKPGTAKPATARPPVTRPSTQAAPPSTPAEKPPLRPVASEGPRTATAPDQGARPPAGPVEKGGQAVAGLHLVLGLAQYVNDTLTRTEADLKTMRGTPKVAAEAVTTLEGTLQANRLELTRLEAEGTRLTTAVADLLKGSRAESATYQGGKLLRPVPGGLNSGFGHRDDPYYHRWQLHEGLDLDAAMGEPIRAAAPGVVSRAGDHGDGYGRLTCVEHGRLNGDRLSTCYAHQSVIRVEPGQAVTAGQVIGEAGSTGASTGPHLHFEVRLGGRAVDPGPWLAP